MKLNNIAVILLSSAALFACGGSDSGEEAAVNDSADAISVTDAELVGNPFMEDWDTPYGVPPFAEIEDGHYMPATLKGVLELRADIAVVTNNPEAPTFENTILAMETAGYLINKVANTFFNITGTELNDTLQGLQSEISPMTSSSLGPSVLKMAVASLTSSHADSPTEP